MAGILYSVVDDDFSDAGFDASFGSHCADDSECQCEDCLGKSVQKPVWSPKLASREGDMAKIKENVLAFMMEARWRNHFSLLALPVEVRILVLRELLY